MGKGPGLFSDIGKKAKDLLTKDYNFDQKFSITTSASTGLAFTSTGIKKNDFFLGDISTQFKNKNVTTDVKIDTSSNIIGTVTIDESAPGLKTIFKFSIPDQRTGKVELHYLHDYVGISTSVGLTAAPMVEFAAVAGTNEIAIGGEVAIDTATGNLTKYNTGLSFLKPDFTSSLILTDKGDTLKASYSHTFNPLTLSTVAAEISHRFSKNENTFSVGALHMLDSFTTVKARLDNHGKLAGLIQHEWRPKSLVTVSGEVDTRALDNNAKFGLSLALKP